MEMFALEQLSAFQIAPKASNQIREVFKSTELTTSKGQFLHSLAVSPAFLNQTKHFFIAGRNDLDWLRPLLNHHTEHRDPARPPCPLNGGLRQQRGRLLDEGRGWAMDASVKFGRKCSWTPEQAQTDHEFRSQQLSNGAIAKKLDISIGKARRILDAV